MKISASQYFGLASVAVIVCLSYFLVKSDVENARLKAIDSIASKQRGLLEDQLRDYEFQFKTHRTYEDGVRDTLIKAGGGSYADGFEAAKTLYKDAGYSDGYHNAIAQFGYQPGKTPTYATEAQAVPVSDTVNSGVER